MQVILHSGLDYLTFWCFQIFCPFVLPIPMLLRMQKHTTILGGKTKLLFWGLDHSCLGGICGIWGLSHPCPLLSSPLPTPR